MNPTQKAYESYDLTLIKLKKSQSHYHLQNLAEIKKRSSHFETHKELINHVPIGELNIRGFIRDYETKLLKNKLTKISRIKATAKINDDDKIYNDNFAHRGIIFRQSKLLKIQEENEKMGKRLEKTSPFMNSKKMDMDYNEKHPKLVNKIRKNTRGIPIFLPEIRQSISQKTFKKTKIDSKKTGCKTSKIQSQVISPRNKTVDDDKKKKTETSKKGENNTQKDEKTIEEPKKEESPKKVEEPKKEESPKKVEEPKKEEILKQEEEHKQEPEIAEEIDNKDNLFPTSIKV